MARIGARTHRTSDKGTVLFARELRRTMTPAEQMLWDRLRRKALEGFRFRRQHPIGSYIADFFCNEVGLVVEVDGEVHLSPTQIQKDRFRDIAMKQYTLEVLRFTNCEVQGNLDAVVEQIRNALLERVKQHKKNPGRHRPPPTS